jgi:tRNA(His) 5'-end guanylyltransferase
MKSDYENRTRFLLPRRTYTVIRVDGKSFHAYTRGCRRPFDEDLMAAMDAAMIALCENIEGARLGYVQSDEISVILTDFGSPQTEAWFDGNVQKIASITASIATAYFNRARAAQGQDGMALFDSRVFTIPDPAEVENYLIWRQQDATRNSISMTAQAHFPHDALQGKSSNELQEMLWQERGINWNDMPAGFKRGRCAVRRTFTTEVEYTDKRSGETKIAENVTRDTWQVEAPPVFTQDREWLRTILP